MSLRVLLADESDTIRKVFQLALQDFNAEVKSVHSGLDVIDVAKTFKPDILFADVLLQKKNGYTLCSEIKQTQGLEQTPVVLMWSSFMELDQNQYQQVKAEDQLEKPFDADNLRGMITKYVSHVSDQEIGDFLSFPDIRTDSPNELGETAQEESSEFNLQNTINEPDNGPLNVPQALDLSALNLAPDAVPTPAASTEASTEVTNNEPPKKTEEGSWLSADLSKFKLDDLKDDNDDDLEKFESLNLGQEIPTEAPAETSPSLPDLGNLIGDHQPPVTSDGSEHMQVANLDELFAKDSNDLPEEAPQTQSSAVAGEATAPSKLTMDTADIEAIVRAHTEEYLTTQIKQQLPSIIEKIVREELNKVLEEEVRLNQDLND